MHKLDPTIPKRSGERWSRRSDEHSQLCFVLQPTIRASGLKLLRIELLPFRKWLSTPYHRVVRVIHVNNLPLLPMSADVGTFECKWNTVCDKLNKLPIKIISSLDRHCGIYKHIVEDVQSFHFSKVRRGTDLCADPLVRVTRVTRVKRVPVLPPRRHLSPHAVSDQPKQNTSRPTAQSSEDRQSFLPHSI